MTKTPLSDSRFGRVLSPATEGFFKGNELDPILRVTASLALAIIAFSGSYLGCYFGVTQAILPLAGIGGGASLIVGSLTWIALSSCLREKAPRPDLGEDPENVKRVLDFSSSDDTPVDAFKSMLIEMARTKNPDLIPEAEKRAAELTSGGVPKERSNSFKRALGFLNFFKNQYGPTIGRTDAGTMIEVAKDGNCVFTAFATTRQMNGSEMGDSSLKNQARALRQDAAKWIQGNVMQDHLLQSYLIEAMSDHWSSPTMKHLRGEAFCQTRMEKLDPYLISAMMFRHTKSEKQTEDFFTPVRDLVADYLLDMKQPGTFAALPEIYALAKMRHCCVKIYSINDDNCITKEPTEIINPKPKTNGFVPHGCSHFAFYGKHYTPFVPSEVFLALPSKGTSGS